MGLLSNLRVVWLRKGPLKICSNPPAMGRDPLDRRGCWCRSLILNLIGISVNASLSCSGRTRLSNRFLRGAASRCWIQLIPEYKKKEGKKQAQKSNFREVMVPSVTPSSVLEDILRALRWLWLLRLSCLKPGCVTGYCRGTCLLEICSHSGTTLGIILGSLSVGFDAPQLCVC